MTQNYGIGQAWKLSELPARDYHLAVTHRLLRTERDAKGLLRVSQEAFDEWVAAGRPVPDVPEPEPRFVELDADGRGTIDLAGRTDLRRFRIHTANDGAFVLKPIDADD